MAELDLAVVISTEKDFFLAKSRPTSVVLHVTFPWLLGANMFLGNGNEEKCHVLVKRIALPLPLVHKVTSS